METKKDILNFCNAAIFYNHKNVGITELNQVRKYIIISFYKTIPHTTIIVSLSINDEIILKINDDDIENIIDNIHDLIENILYMLSFEKLIKDNNGELIIGDDNELKREKPNNFGQMLPKYIINETYLLVFNGCKNIIK